jgi:hypothetical protein
MSPIKLHSLVLSQMKAFSLSSLKHNPSIRITDEEGKVREEPFGGLQGPLMTEEELARRKQALLKVGTPLRRDMPHIAHMQ